jgi:hypothetical protein
MAKGSASKEIITNKILEVFSNAFVNGKEIRVPMEEDGSSLEIKITLTAAKDIIGGGISNSVTTSDSILSQTASTAGTFVTPSATEKSEPTEEEKQAVADVLARLGFK